MAVVDRKTHTIFMWQLKQGTALTALAGIAKKTRKNNDLSQTTSCRLMAQQQPGSEVTPESTLTHLNHKLSSQTSSLSQTTKKETPPESSLVRLPLTKTLITYLIAKIRIYSAVAKASHPRKALYST